MMICCSNWKSIEKKNRHGEGFLLICALQPVARKESGCELRVTTLCSCSAQIYHMHYQLWC